MHDEYPFQDILPPTLLQSFHKPCLPLSCNLSETLSPSLLQVRRIDYYQRTDQALSQFLSGEMPTSDVTTYLHGNGLLTLRVAQLPEGQELPGAATNQIWFWLRPRQVPPPCHSVAKRLRACHLDKTVYLRRGSVSLFATVLFSHVGCPRRCSGNP